MTSIIDSTLCSNSDKLYAGTTKENIRADIDIVNFKSKKECENLYDKKIKLFNYTNSLVENEVDDIISKKEIEAYNKEEKNKKPWSIIGLMAIGISIAVTAVLTRKHLKKIDVLENLIKTKPLQNDTIEALKLYQTDEGAYLINSRLRKGVALSESEIRDADTAIQSIRKGMCKIKPLTVYRGEDFSFIQSQNKEIAIRLKRALLESNTQEIQKILEEIKDKPLVQKSFMSTSLEPSQSFGGQVQWVFNITNGKKAIYMNPKLGLKAGEKELLLSEDSVVSVQDMQIKKDAVRGKVLKILATIS